MVHEMIISPSCCSVTSVITVLVVIRWLVYMVHSFYLNSLCWEILWTYKGKEVSCSGAAYTGGGSYTGGDTGDGSYGGYSGDDRKGYSDEGSYKGHSGGYRGVYW